MTRGAIILSGGRSTRMGQDKALMALGNQSLLERVLHQIAPVVEPQHIVIVASPDQHLPSLSSEIKILRDATPHPGPLQAFVQGLAEFEGRADAVFLTGCDTPLIVPAVLEFLFAQLGDADVAVVEESERLHPLLAVYHPRILAAAREKSASQNRSLHGLIESLHARRIPAESLRTFDPSLQSLVNINTPEDFRRSQPSD